MTTEDPDSPATPKRFPVVGIGASAGGLEALKQLFGGLPADGGLGYVVVQHLDPNHESLMVDLLSRYTAMPVVQITDGMAVAPDRVHVIPPNRSLTLADGRLQLHEPPEPRGMRMPIDHFFRSLAEALEEYAICIVLSGTGADGTLGLREVKGHGGMAMVQVPETAQYDGMPRSALATGLVDYLLELERMPEALTKYVRHFYARGKDIERPAQERAPDYLQAILAELRSRTRHDFRFYKESTLLRRIERRMGLSYIEGLGDYLEFLRTHAEEATQLFKDLLIGVTGFFREPEAFEVIGREVLPELLRGRSDDEPIRVWVTGCATGEEAYSLAMLLHEAIGSAGRRCGVQVFATDIDTDALEQARAGVYPESIAADVTPARLKRFFTHEEERYRVNKPVRESVVFAAQNLINDPPFSKLDLISCRNLLIYLDQEIQKRLIGLFHFALKDPGFLFLGSSETVGQGGLFQPLSKHWRIYRRSPHAVPAPPDFPLAVASGALRGELAGTPSQRRARNLGELTQQSLLAEYAPAAVVIDHRQEILYFFGPTSDYLQFPTGEPTRDLMAVARDGLRSKLRSTIHRVRRGEGAAAVESDARMHQDGAYRPVRIRVRPLESAPGLLLVSFAPAPELRPAQPTDAGEGEEGGPLRQLEYELQVTREDLQSTIEELETSNEELKASNEEAMSMNEELQSTNEELETSKEELQSLNEELGTVNNQLQDKVQELESTNNDLSNLLSSTEIATLFLDSGLRIKRFTPSATALFNLIPSDQGRPISDIVQKTGDGDLVACAREVLRTLQPDTDEVSGEDGRCYLRRILPYRTADDRIDGVVVTFSDVSGIKQALLELTRSEDRFRILFEKSPMFLCEQNWSGVREYLLELEAAHGDLKVYFADHLEALRKCLKLIRLTKANEATLSLFGAREEGELFNDAARFFGSQCLKEFVGMLVAVAHGQTGYAYEECIEILSGQEIPVFVQIQVMPGSEGDLSRVLVTLVDITRRKEVERALHEREYRLRAILDNAADALITVDGDGRIQDLNQAAEGMFGIEAARARGSDIRNLIHLPDTPEEAKGGQEDFLAEYISRPRPRKPWLRIERTGLRSDGSRFPLDASIGEIDHLGQFSLIIRDLSERKRLEQEVIEASTMEQERIGREIHDGLGQQLTALDLLAASLRNKLEKGGSPDTPMASELERNLRLALREVRAVARGLAPVEIDPNGLAAALERLAEDSRSATGIKCRVHAPSPVTIADSRTATHLYRIVQEAVNNAVKHARPQRIDIVLEQEDGCIRVCVSDDGSGLRVTPGEDTGLGLHIMRYRAHLVGARLRIYPNGEKGTRVCCTLAKKERPAG